MKNLMFFMTITLLFFSCAISSLNNKNMKKNSEISIRNHIVHYQVLDREMEDPNVILNMGTVVFEIRLIAFEISKKENLKTFLLFKNYSSYYNYYSNLKMESSDEGYLGLYHNGNFIPK